MLVASPYKVRAMTMADIPQVVEVERESFPTTWPQTAYRRELANRMARYLVLVDSRSPPEDEPRKSRRSLLGFWRRQEAQAGPT
jgi:hypothetical protein